MEAVDRWQQDARPAAFVVAVVRKFGDDRGGPLAAQLTNYGILSLFPLLLLVVTVPELLLGDHSSWAHRVEHSALSKFPIAGRQIGANLHEPARRGAVAVSVGLVGPAWGSRGVLQSAQLAMAEVWNIPALDRPGYVARLGRTAVGRGARGQASARAAARGHVRRRGTRPDG